MLIQFAKDGAIQEKRDRNTWDKKTTLQHKREEEVEGARCDKYTKNDKHKFQL